VCAAWRQRMGFILAGVQGSRVWVCGGGGGVQLQAPTCRRGGCCRRRRRRPVILLVRRRLVAAAVPAPAGPRCRRAASSGGLLLRPVLQLRQVVLLRPQQLIRLVQQLLRQLDGLGPAQLRRAGRQVAAASALRLPAPGQARAADARPAAPHSLVQASTPSPPLLRPLAAPLCPSRPGRCQRRPPGAPGRSGAPPTLPRPGVL
jgi:hypothetical protein